MLRFLVSFVAVSPMLLVCATSSSIGLVKSTGEFRVDGSLIRGNGNLFEGNVVETTASRSTIQLADVQITLAPDSRARLYRDHTVLEKGSGVMKNSSQHVIEADALRIEPTSRNSELQIELANSSVLVASIGGPADVRNSAGVLAAHLLPGMSLAFQPGTVSPSVVQMTGTVTSRGGAYFLTDQTTNVTVQLQGANVGKFVGKRVQISGTVDSAIKPVDGASEVVRISAISTAKAAGAVSAGTGAAATGLSHAATAAIIGGVAVGGTVGGLAAAGTFSSGFSISRQ